MHMLQTGFHLVFTPFKIQVMAHYKKEAVAPNATTIKKE